MSTEQKESSRSKKRQSKSGEIIGEDICLCGRAESRKDKKPQWVMMVTKRSVLKYLQSSFAEVYYRHNRIKVDLKEPRTHR